MSIKITIVVSSREIYNVFTTVYVAVENVSLSVQWDKAPDKTGAFFMLIHNRKYVRDIM